jgi:hypothetical protein
LTDRRPIGGCELGVVDGVTVCVSTSGWPILDAVTSDADLISCGLGLHAA